MRASVNDDTWSTKRGSSPGGRQKKKDIFLDINGGMKVLLDAGNGSANGSGRAQGV